jgi:hypothetical protein
VAAQRECRQRRRDSHGRTEPHRRLDGQREIERDAAAENDGEPEDAPLALGGERGGEAAEGVGAPRLRGVKPFLGQRDVRHRLSLGATLQDRFLARK